MNQLIQYKQLINPLKNAEVIELWDFPDYPVLYLLKDIVGTSYLSYLSKYVDDGIEERHIISVSQARLELLRTGVMAIKFAYDNPENDIVLIALISESNGETLEQFQIPIGAYNGIGKPE